MKNVFLCQIIALVMAAVWLPSCVETTTKVTDPVTGLVTVTTVKQPAPGSIELAGQGIAVLGARTVREEKSAADMPTLLRGWKGRAEVAVDEGPIRPEEIEQRKRGPD